MNIGCTMMEGKMRMDIGKMRAGGNLTRIGIRPVCQEGWIYSRMRKIPQQLVI